MQVNRSQHRRNTLVEVITILTVQADMLRLKNIVCRFKVGESNRYVTVSARRLLQFALAHDNVPVNLAGN